MHRAKFVVRLQGPVGRTYQACLTKFVSQIVLIAPRFHLEPRCHLSQAATYHTLPPIVRCHLSHDDTYHTLLPITRSQWSYAATYRTLPPITRSQWSNAATYHTPSPITRCHISHAVTYRFFVMIVILWWAPDTQSYLERIYVCA